MELKIINKKEYPLLSRTRVESEIAFEKSTPSKDEIKSKLGKDLGKDEKLIVVKGIYTEYGLKKCKNLSYVYENEESLKRIEVQKEKKKEAKPEEKAAEKPQESKKEAKEEQKTEKKEAKKEEQKPKEAKLEEKSKQQAKENKQ